MVEAQPDGEALFAVVDLGTTCDTLSQRARKATAPGAY